MRGDGTQEARARAAGRAKVGRGAESVALLCAVLGTASWSGACTSPSSSPRDERSAETRDPSASEAPVVRALPIVEIRGLEVAVDDVPVATIEMRGATFGPGRVPAIEEALRARRVEQGAAFAGVVGIRPTNDAPFIAVGSVVFSAASAGYVRVALQRIGDGAILDLDVDLALHASPTELHLELTAGEDARIAWRPRPRADSGSASLDRAPRREVGAIVCEQWEAHGAHRDPDDASRDRAVLHVDPDVPLRELWEVAEGVASCRREQRVRPANALSSGIEDVPAFGLYLALGRLPLRAPARAAP